MFQKTLTFLEGKKTYGVSILGIIVGLIGHFYGPLHVGPLEIPQFTSNEIFTAVWGGGLFSALRAKKEPSPLA